MREQRNKISFRGQKIYVGIDVHLKSWSVTVLSATSVLKKFSQNPAPEALHGFLTRSLSGSRVSFGVRSGLLRILDTRTPDGIGDRQHRGQPGRRTDQEQRKAA